MVKFIEKERCWVRCVGTNVWVEGEVVKINKKTIRVYNSVRGIEGNYSYNNVKKRNWMYRNV